MTKLKIMDYSLLVGLHNLSDKEQASGDLSKSKNSEFIFYRDFGGYQSSFEDNSRGPEVYYLGIDSVCVRLFIYIYIFIHTNLYIFLFLYRYN